jgi:hypothetical protein
MIRIQAEAVDCLSPLELYYIGIEVEVPGMPEQPFEADCVYFQGGGSRLTYRKQRLGNDALQELKLV